MSDTDDYIRRLSKMFQAGTRTISTSHLFPNTELNHQQIQSIVEILESKQAIRCTYQMGQITPYQIQILPGCVAAESQIKSRYSFEGLKNTFQSHPVTGIILFIIVAVCAGLGVIKLIWPELFPE